MFGMDILRIFKHNSAPAALLVRACVRAHEQCDWANCFIILLLVPYYIMLVPYYIIARARVRTCNGAGRTRAHEQCGHTVMLQTKLLYYLLFIMKLLHVSAC